LKVQEDQEQPKQSSVQSNQAKINFNCAINAESLKMKVGIWDVCF